MGETVETLDIPTLRKWALYFFKKGILSPADAHLHLEEFKRAHSSGDNKQLAACILKMTRSMSGAQSLADFVKQMDGADRFGQLRATVTDESLHTAWNQPGFEGKNARERAKELAGQGYGTAGAIERRARRMRERGFDMPGASQRARKRKRYH